MRSFGGGGIIKSRRCTICSIQYPPFIRVCRICNGATWPMYKNGPDEDWEQRVARSLGEGVYISPQPIAYTVQHPAGVEMPLHIWEGRAWMPHATLTEAGYKYLETGSIVLVNNRFYELEGYSESRQMWWVEEVPVDGQADYLTPKMFTDG